MIEILFLTFIYRSVLSGVIDAAQFPALPPSQKREAAGKIVSFNGDVLIRNEEQSGSLARKVKLGEYLYPGDVINTNSKGFAKLLMTDHTILDLGASSLFKLDEYNLKKGSDRNVVLTMNYGTVRASVNLPVSTHGKFQLRTKSAVMGVRGTEFIVTSNISDGEKKAPASTSTTTGIPSSKAQTPGAPTQSQTQITVIKGSVAVASTTSMKAQPTLVGQGKQMTTVASFSKTGFPTRSPASVPAMTVVSLSSAQLENVQKSSKIVDHTFSQSVVIESGGESSGGAGASTLAAVATSIEAQTKSGSTLASVGVGTPGTGPPPISSTNNSNRLTGGPVHVQILFKR